MRKIILIVILSIFFLIIRALITQQGFIGEAKKAQDPVKAVRYYERALLFYVPLSPYNKEAVEGILEKCKNMIESEQKLYCYETLRSSLYQIRSFYIPYREELEKLNSLIAELKTSEMINWKYNGFSQKHHQSIYNYHIEILKYDGSPSTFWSVISVFSLIGWIASVLFIILKGFKEPIRIKLLIGGIACFALFFFLWITGLLMA